jgi:5-formyltetrahydrofolate cyclo-ligase
MNRAFEDTTTTLLNKKALRHQMVQARLAMSAEAWEKASENLSENLSAWLDKQGLPRIGQVIAFCWPVQNEPDIRPLMLKWRKSGITIALPVVITPGKPLEFRAWEQECVLQLDRYGIPTPTNGPLVTPDILLLPGNAFDNAGYRLGYGGGFFDRTLAMMTPRPLVLGLCFEHARVTDLKPEPHDQVVDALITEKTPILTPRHG